MYRLCRVLSSALSLKQTRTRTHTHIAGLFESGPPDNTDDRVVRRVPFKLMLGGKA